MTKVFVMLSGGVDSSVVAARLIDAGYDVTGVFMKNWSYDRLSQKVADKLMESCPTEEDAQSAQAVAQYLGIPFKVVNFEQEYWDYVVEPFFKQYEQGLTPNPDIWCNQFVKFGVFLDWALNNGADLVASGHYVQVKKTSQGVEFLRGIDPAKDQSYFLSYVDPSKLKYALFPIGHLYKSQVRAEAYERGLPTATRKDSQGICFIGKIPIKEFLKERLKEKDGPVVLPDGTRIGTHEGAWFYTIGQRHIGFKQTKAPTLGNDPQPLYVVSKDVKNNILTVDFDPPGKNSGNLWQDKFFIHSIHWYGQPQTQNLEIEVRYHQNPRSFGQVKLFSATEGEVWLKQPVRAVTGGQTVVFSKGNKIIGAGIIDEIKTGCETN
jgi:tRNA-specific 2-thiouridylase